jgi:L-alanine-DL-glutamate epimerase-like enolase superfamily enzyme
MGRRSLALRVETWPVRAPFVISGHVWNAVDVLVAEITVDGMVGRGEAAGVFYHDETGPRMLADAEQARAAVEAGASRLDLLRILPACGARNSLDAALWELESAAAGVSVSELAGLGRATPRLTTCTVGLGSPEAMAAGAIAYAEARAIKLKLAGDELDADRVRAVRAARPGVWLGVDGNQGFDLDHLKALAPVLVEASVSLCEQPLPVGQEALLDGLDYPIALAADETVQDLADLDRVIGRFQVVNLKLDKSGGLTRALEIAEAARERGLELMVGNMLGTSLAMAPAFVLAQLCDVVDLDGPLLMARDRTPAAIYADGLIDCPRAVWGAGASPSTAAEADQ